MRKPNLCGTLVLMLMAGSVLGLPLSSEYDQIPRPEGGMELLKKNVELPLLPYGMNWERTVTAMFRVNPDGSISHVQILKSGGSGFDQAVKRAIMGVAWNPAVIDGQQVPVKMKIPFKFFCR